MTTIRDDTDRAYDEALAELTAVLTSPLSTEEQARKAEAAIHELNRTRLEWVLNSFEERTTNLNGLVQTLNGITASMRLDLTDEIIYRFRKIVDQGRALLVKEAGEAMPEHVPPGELPAPDVVEADDVAISEPPPEKTETPEKDEVDVAPPERPDLPPLPPPAAEPPPSLVPGNLKEDYERLFASCAIHPDKTGKVNWHLEKLKQGRERYEVVGNELGIPWWFIGAIQAMETGFRFNRHLHNGDSLTGRTVRVPLGRPVESAPPFQWEDSARDALIYMKFDEWNDWSVAGVLYKWERYNGFGYRNYHSDILSPYLWSYTNHYSKGKYVEDGVFDPEAVSKQCGTAAILRALVNKGVVIF